MHELLEELQRDDIEIPENIYILPPENANGKITDEDSGEEDNVDLNNLPGGQLRAQVEVELNGDQHNEEDDWESEDDLPLSTFKTAKKKNYSKKNRVFKWVKKGINPTIPLFQTMCINTIVL